VTKLKGLKESKGPVLYSELSMKELVDNDSARCNNKEFVIN
jgi:hypothetical protein